jgi:membrane fusion protein (multidrug efflux system)
MRRRLLGGALALALLAAAGYGVRLFLDARSRVTTDNASVEAAVVVVSAQVAGPVARVLVEDNADLREGQLLVELDPRDHEIRVAQARAAVAMAEAAVRAAEAEVPLSRETAGSRVQQARAALEAARTTAAAARALVDEAGARQEGRRAAVAAARAEVTVAEATADKARADLDRTSRLAAGGLVSRQDHDAAGTAHRVAAAVLEAARRRLAQAEREADEAVAEVRRRGLAVEEAERRVEEAEALVGEATSRQGEVPVKEAGAGRAVAALQQARADLAAAERDLAKTRLHAPVAGAVARKSVERGQLVQVGQPLLAIVPLAGVWVVANFKETQLGGVRPGLPATVRVDTFPDRVFRGTVDSVGAGTGSRFSLLPPENATGNWVKVVQRVPVKIALDGYRANPHLLRPGMSATVTIALR